MKLFSNLFQKAAPDHEKQALEAHQLLFSLVMMAWFVEAKDPYSGGHLWRVSQYAKLLAQAIGLPKKEVSRIMLGGFLHDLGKVGVPDAVLKKTERLTDEEFDVIKNHPDVGLNLVSLHPYADLVRTSIVTHHERIDGTGYPKGLKGAEIPLDGKIIAICDAFDAMTSSRPYRKGMPIEKAIAIIEKEAGTQFDADLVAAFVKMGKEGGLNHILGHTDEGIPLHNCGMCGPLLVRQKNHRAGHLIYCANCTGEYVIEKTGAGFVTKPTGKTGNARQMQPDPDTDLLTKSVWGIVEELL